MSTGTIPWQYDGKEIELGFERRGEGPLVLLLPALSSISTRQEMRPLQNRLARSFSTLSIDWPGFGDLPRPRLDWRPEIYDAFLDHLFGQIAARPFAVIAAGHGAGYVLRHFARETAAQSRLVLLSCTWRGPLPTLTEGYRAIYPKLPKIIDLPVLGTLLYRLNVNRLVISMMANGHVYSEKGWLKGKTIREKLAVTGASGARHASSRFVTGCLDPFTSRRDQSRAVAAARSRILHLFAAEAPVKSRQDMEALAEQPNLKNWCLPAGKLSFYEEFPDAAYEPIRRFLA